MLHIDEVFYSNFSGGAMDGNCGVTIELGMVRDASVVALLNAIRDFGKTRLVRIIGDFHRNPADELEELVNTLCEQGVLVSLVTKGTERGPASAGVTYRIALIDENPWLMYGAHEIRYSPVAPMRPIQLPRLHPVHSSAYLYIVPNANTAAGDVISFVESYPFFRIYSPPLKTYRKTIALKEEE